MSRVQRQIDDMAVQSILHTALDRFHRDGYAATSMRDIAADAHLGIKGLYEHFPSKQAILAEIVDTTHDAALMQTEAAVASAGSDPADRLEAAVWAQCDFGARHPKGCLIAATELRSLEPTARARAIDKMHRLRHVFTEIIGAGAADGVFEVDDPGLVSRAVFDLCSAMPTSLDLLTTDAPRKVARTYCDLVGRMTRVVSRA